VTYPPNPTTIFVVTISTTHSVVGIDLSLSFTRGVGACGLPVKTGLAIGANPFVFTHSVVGIDLLLSFIEGVGACGLPVKTGLAMGANPVVVGKFTCPTLPALTDTVPSNALGPVGAVDDTTTMVALPTTTA